MAKREWWAISEIEWLQSTDSSKLIHFLEHQRGIADRKWWLFAVGCCQFILDAIHDHRSRNAFDVVERLADGNATTHDLDAAHRLACEVLTDIGADRKWYPPEDVARVITMPNSTPSSMAYGASMRVCSVIGQFAWKAAMGKGRRYQDKMRRMAYERQGNIHLSLVRCVFGNPFRPAASDPRWLTPTVVALAQGIYDDRAFNRLPVLADALEEAGCTDPAILEHCRGPGPHARGCWVVDLLLGNNE